MLDINNLNYVIGTKQTKRALKNNEVIRIIIATDVEDKIVSTIVNSCNESSQDIQIERNYTMEELGKHCGIDVGAAMIAILKDEGKEVK